MKPTTPSQATDAHIGDEEQNRKQKKKKIKTRRRTKTEEHGKVEVKRELWVLVQPSYSQQGYGRQLPRWRQQG